MASNRISTHRQGADRNISKGPLLILESEYLVICISFTADLMQTKANMQPYVFSLLRFYSCSSLSSLKVKVLLGYIPN